MKTKKILAVMLAMGTVAAALPMGSLASAEETPTLTIALSQNANVEDYDTNYLTQLIESECGINVEFLLLPTATEDAKSKLALMASSGEKLPDVVCMQLTSLEVSEYGSKGVFLPMNDYLDNAELTPNFNSIGDEDKAAILQAITSPDGNIYTLADWSPEDFNLTPYRCWINKTWLDTLGLEVPTTTDELKTVLEAFATQDPNGNGINDEIALSGSVPSAAWGCFTPYYLMNSFIFYNGDLANNGLALAEDGETVIAPFITEEWKAGLEYMNSLCEEGLLDPSMFTMDATQFTAMLDQTPNQVGCVCVGGWGYWTNGLDSENFQDFVLLPPLEGPEGVAYAASFEYCPNFYYNITKDCTDPELAMKVGDFFYRKDVSYTTRYGEEGVDWSTDEADTAERVGLYEDMLGIPCKIAILDNQWSKVQNKHWYAACPHYLSTDDYRGLDSMQTGDDNRNAVLRATSYEMYYDAHPEMLPTLVYTQDEAEQISSIATDVKTYVSSSLAEFVTGNRPLSDWDNYLEELENMGLSYLVETAQTAYDRAK
ncbi:MAG: extracellular solute-binding protein [Eubacteriales bacterium]|nr:extracellular solute-binding protein [Eubacteriales bacterium]